MLGTLLPSPCDIQLFIKICCAYMCFSWLKLWVYFCLFFLMEIREVTYFPVFSKMMQNFVRRQDLTQQGSYTILQILQGSEHI